MGKALKIAIGIGILAAVVFSGPLGITFALNFGGLLGLGILTKGTLLAIGASLALGTLAQAFLQPSIPNAQRGRLNVSNDPTTARKAVLGTTAFNTDLIFFEPSGEDDEIVDYVIVCAAHEVASFDSIYFENNLAWTSGGGVTSTYDGFLTVNVRTVGTSGNTIAVSSNWGSSERMTGCAYVHLEIKRSADGDDDSPLVSGLPSRVTIIGEGAPLYDPRLDSTVAGGSGSHRADNQSTWGSSYSPADSFDNPALQLLWALLGWEINGKLSIGFGIPPSRIDMESFIEAANICDESVDLAAGGTQRRYRSSGTFSDGDDRLEVVNTLLAAMNGTLRDNSGKLALSILKDETASPVLDFDDDDIMGGYQFSQTGGLSGSSNVVRGRYVDNSPQGLYQLREYPAVTVQSVDDIERVLQLDLAYVEDGIRAQRIAKQVLLRSQFRGQFQAPFSLKALGCEVGDVVTLTFSKKGWSSKLFRVVQKGIGADGVVPLTLVEESAQIYAWDREETAPGTLPSITPFNPVDNPVNIAAGTADWPNVTDSNGTRPENNADVTADNQVAIPTPAAFNIQADSAGVTTTNLTTATRSIMVYSGGSLVTSGVTAGTPSATAGIGVASAAVSSGIVTVTLSQADASGSVTIPVVFGGNTYNIVISVTRAVSAPAQEGGSGTTSVTDGSWLNISSTTFVQVTNDPMQIDSDASGNLEYLFSASYSGTGAVIVDVQYSTNNSTWTTVSGSQTTGSAPITIPGEEEDGFISKAPTTFSVSASTNYYVRLRARRSSGSGVLSFIGETFTVRQP
jgi:hypothetical protein